MPYRQRGSFRAKRALSLRPVDSMKNVFNIAASTGTTLGSATIISAVDAPTAANTNEVQRGSTVKTFHLSFDVCGLAGTGVRQVTNVYLIKNPGSNLVNPGAFVVGSSNEKKFIFKQWSFQTMRNQDGNPPFHVQEWIKIPPRYRRMGTNDLVALIFETDTAAGHITGQAIYKWFR